MRTFLQILAFFFPRPVNAWIHRLAGAKIGKHVIIHPGVFILAESISIGDYARIRFGTLVNVRSFDLGSKSLIGYFMIAKGISDFKVGGACVIGPRTMINCDCPVTLGYYSGVGPNACLFTHGSFLPVTEGYRTKFGPITIKDKAWVTMSSTVGPGVTVGEGTNVMPGTVLVESVGKSRLVAGNPARLVNIPLMKDLTRMRDLGKTAREILSEYREWALEFKHTRFRLNGDVLSVPYKRKRMTITIDKEDGDIVLYTKSGKRRDSMYFNLVDLGTDAVRHPAKRDLEAYMRLYFGLTFLEGR